MWAQVQLQWVFTSAVHNQIVRCTCGGRRGRRSTRRLEWPAGHLAWVWGGLLALALVAAATAAQAKLAPDGFADLVAGLLPSVVNISTTQVIEGRGGVDLLPPGSPFEEFCAIF